MQLPSGDKLNIFLLQRPPCPHSDSKIDLKEGEEGFLRSTWETIQIIRISLILNMIRTITKLSF